MAFASITPTAMKKMAEPITFTCGGTPRAAWPQTYTGNVISLPELKYVITKSSTEIANASRPPARIAGARSGSVILRNVTHSFAPRSAAASSRCRSKSTSRARTVTTTNEMQNITCAMKIVQNPSVNSVWLRNSVSSEAPSTISGAAIGRKMRKFSGPRPRKRCRTSASAISAPSAVAEMLARTAIRAT